MIKKGAQKIIINDSTLFPINFYHKKKGSNEDMLSNPEGLRNPSAGTYKLNTANGIDNPTALVAFDNTANLINYERMSIPGFNTNIDALRVVRALRYNSIPEQVDRAAITLGAVVPLVGSTVQVKLTLASTDKYFAEYNTVFADGKITMYRDVFVSSNITDTIKLAKEIAKQFNNTEQRPGNESKLMNVLAVDGTSNGIAAVQFTAQLGIEISKIEVLEVPVSGNPLMTVIYYPSKTTLPTALASSAVAPVFGTVVANQVGFFGRGVYDRVKFDFIQTSSKVYPYSDLSSDGSQLPIKGANYSLYVFSVKVNSGTHGDYNNTPVEYFDYHIYVNTTTCAATAVSLDLWFDSLNNAATTGRKVVLGAASGATQDTTLPGYGTAYANWTIPYRAIFTKAGYNVVTGVDAPTILADNLAIGAASGFQILHTT